MPFLDVLRSFLFCRIVLPVTLACTLVNCSASAGILVQLRTSFGDLDVELFDRDKPVTVQNFIRYAETDSYESGFIHRWVPGFVIQGGGFRTVNRGGRDLIEAIPTFNTIENEYRVGRTLSNTYGTIAMARAGGVTNSATSQWFFNLKDNSGLDNVDGGFTVFGRVLRGTNVLNRFNNVSPTNGLYILQLDPPLADLPVLSATPTFNDLMFVQVRLLQIELRVNDQGERIVSWVSIKDQLNHLEAASGPNAVWQPIFSAPGTGNRLEFTDREPSGSSRLYRVRVDY